MDRYFYGKFHCPRAGFGVGVDSLSAPGVIIKRLYGWIKKRSIFSI